MADFLTTHGVSYHIESIIVEAKSELFLVSPYLQLSKLFCERLRDASDKNVTINIVYGKNALKFKERDFFSNLNSVKLYHFENLHAKCFFNEHKMVITSMNMYDFSEKNNREMGILITRLADKDLYTNAVTETLSIIEHSNKIELSKSNNPILETRPKSDTSLFQDIPEKLKIKLNGLTLSESTEIGLITIDEHLKFEELDNNQGIFLKTGFGDIKLSDHLSNGAIENYGDHLGELIFRTSRGPEGRLLLILTTI